MSSQHSHENRWESRRSLRHRMAQRAGGEGSPKKKTSLNLVTGFYHYLRGKCDPECVSPFEMNGVRKREQVHSVCVYVCVWLCVTRHGTAVWTLCSYCAWSCVFRSVVSLRSVVCVCV